MDKIEHFTNDVLIFYVFYSDNCPHSQKFLKEQWDILRKKYSTKVIFNKINCGEGNFKNICKTFGVKSVPAICIAKENDGQTNPIFFKGVRSLDNLEKFLNQHIELNNLNHTEFFNKTDTINKVKTPTINDSIEFDQNEDMLNKTYKYCINYVDPEKKQFNHCQTINEKEMPNLKSWQGSYTVVSDYLKMVTGKDNLSEKKNVTFKNKDHLADWHLCDPILLQTIKSNVQKLKDNKDDLDINTAIEYACGFNK